MPWSLPWKELGENLSASEADKFLEAFRSYKPTRATQAFCHEMAEQQIRPQRIRNAMSRKFATPLTALSSLDKIQNFVGYYGRTKMENHDRVKGIEEWIMPEVFDSTKVESQTFTFSWHNDDSGKSIVGNGGEAAPFYIGLSTKTLIRNLSEPSENFMAYAKASTMKYIYDIHFASREGEAMLLREAVMRKWMSFACVVDFARYMQTQWLYGAFCNWQVHQTASCFASTNNPVERFNRVLKRGYTLNSRLKVRMLLRELSNCCQNESSNENVFDGNDGIIPRELTSSWAGT
ncbi:hypothetical protein PHMEG_00024837 [Phytophthora megakarya]|uniref:MULE transposase domain-containing protein n=1 Tax=Phytophthora megakarya TaxID=4795 RepID=A0A225VF68_9STRA|nr:hypothetical protein PHMEG_00024837 [Phytophthora megakarya]